MPRASAGIDLAAYARRNPRAAAALEAQGVPAQAKARARGSGGAGERAEAALYATLTALGIAHEAQYPWGATLPVPRAFRADAAIPELKLLLEIDGGVHSIGEKRERDLARQNLAIRANWAVLRFTPKQAESGEAALFISEYLAERGFLPSSMVK